MSSAVMNSGATKTAWEVWSRASGMGLLMRGMGVDPFSSKDDMRQFPSPPPVPDMADDLLKRMQKHELEPQAFGRSASFLGEPPRQQDNKQRTILGAR